MAGKARRAPGLIEYFRFPHPGWIASISFGLWLLGMSVVAPTRIPTYLGPVGAFGTYMGTSHPQICTLIMVFTIVAHCGEAAYAGILCGEKGLTMGSTVKWILSTLLFGFSSLIRLKPFDPSKAKSS